MHKLDTIETVLQTHRARFFEGISLQLILGNVVGENNRSEYERGIHSEHAGFMHAPMGPKKDEGAQTTGGTSSFFRWGQSDSCRVPSGLSDRFEAELWRQLSKFTMKW